MKLYIVVLMNLSGHREQLAAYFSEEKARYAAGQLVGKAQGYLHLETIDVLDEPVKPS